MEKHIITITHKKAVHNFEVADYPHHNHEHCKYRVFENGAFVASFEPDAQNCLYVCKNEGNLDGKLLGLIADQIETQLPHPTSKHFN